MSPIAPQPTPPHAFSSSAVASVKLPEPQELLRDIQEISASLARDSHGPNVVSLQQALYVLGHFPSDRKRDGHFGPITQKAVGDFQLLNEVLPHATSQGYGVFGPKTKNALVDALWRITKASSIPPQAPSTHAPKNRLIEKKILQITILVAAAAVGSLAVPGAIALREWFTTDTTGLPPDQLEVIPPGTIVEFKSLKEMHVRGYLIRSFDGKKYQIHPQFQLVDPNIPMNPKDPTTFRVVRKSEAAKK